MPATVTLSSTTLDSGVTPSQRSVRVASTSGLIPSMKYSVGMPMRRPSIPRPSSAR